MMVAAAPEDREFPPPHGTVSRTSRRTHLVAGRRPARLSRATG
ncbi:MAG: hypothetical protein AVDCRST_MAG65-130 [uncultured Solirubrobacteraceae bacterium]|uniref:Uncharacterized protein n=1 Tax=uncultured Solirubrobacteraceae bacterium TaxID=1162706 RepID=A0A6J4R8J3_9ACTN|nr:MAG: hypothetical protein AVDCRST_MAG65-130 [uncultured Solirubrobacteraceae bacterium]